MMLKKRPLHYMIIMLPLFILFVMSGYFLKNTWGKYQTSKTFKETLESAKLLQKYEFSVLNETLCMALVQNNDTKKSQICTDRIAKSNTLLEALDQSDESLVRLQEDVTRIKENSKIYSIDDLEKVLSNRQTANVAEGSKEKYLSEGLDDYATKPVEIDVLKSLIAKHTETV